MANKKKVTVRLDATGLACIRALVDAGKATSVTGFVQHAVAVCLDDMAEWEATLAEPLAQTGGDLSADERAWADRTLRPAKEASGPAYEPD